MNWTMAIRPAGGRWLRPARLMMLGLLALSWGISAAKAAEVRAELDREAVTEGETVTLVLQTDDPQQSLETDLQALAVDFHVIDQRSETQMSIVNGRQSAVVRQLLTLEPKRTGTLTIPSLQFRGGSVTPAMRLDVAEAPTLAPGELPPVFIEVELDPQEGPYYVHAQLSLKVRIFYQQNLTEAAINPPAPDQASVRLLDEVPYQADRNGERYRVLERRYAIFPERSGDLVIPPMQLTGRLIERSTDRLWQPSVKGRRVRIESDPMTLAVSPRPAEFSGDQWLPARRMELAQAITDGESVQVGEPVTRTVIVDAVGLEEHMLEEPPWPELADARIYPDQPQGISRDDGQWVLGHREYRYAVVPETPGTLVLPELRVPWWDTVNHVERVAVLPAHRVEVLPSQVAGLEPVDPQPAPTAGTVMPAAGGVAAWPWQLLSAGLALGWLVSFLSWRRRRSPVPDTRSGGTDEREKDAVRRLRKACGQNDAKGAHEALGRWFRRHGPHEVGDSLLVWARTLGEDPLGAEIRALDRAAFGGSPDWQGAGTWTAFQAWRKAQASRRKGGGAERGADDPLDLYAAAR